MNAAHISNHHWDMLLPVKTDCVAESLGFRVLPVNMDRHSDVKLMLSVEKGVKTIGYNPKDTTREIRQAIAIGIAKYVNGRVGPNDFLKYADISFKNAESLEHNTDLKMAWELVMPRDALRTMVLRIGQTDVKDLAYNFDVSISDITKRLREAGLLF